MQKDNFKFWCPVDICKAIDENTGEELMLLGGIASTADEDSDGEFLDPKGFDIKPLIEKGMVNWHHQARTNPGTIVGEPTKAEIRKDGLYIETKLYPSSPIAVDIWNLAKTLEADSQTRRLGYSIEGKVVKRKSDNPSSPDYKKIIKAIITGVAITHMPKNPKTFANIIKGDIDDDFNDEDEEVRDDKEIKKETENKEEEDKAITTESAAALKKESVDDDLKVTAFTKSEVMDRIFGDIPGIEIEKAENIYSLIKKISIMAKRKSVTNDDIVKAYEALGFEVDEKLLVKAESDAEDTDDDAEDTDDDEVDEDEVDEETEETDNDDADDDTDEDEKEKKPIRKGNLFTRFDRIEKALSISHLNQTKYIKALGILVKAQSTDLEKAISSLNLANDKIDEQADLIKSQQNEINQLNERLEQFASGGATPKSMRHAAPVERQFAKGNDSFFEKGEDTNPGLAQNQVSITNRAAVAEILDQATFAKGYDDEFSKACMSFEASHQLPDNIIARIKNEFGVEIIK